MDSDDKKCCFGIILIFVVIALALFFLFGSGGSDDTTPKNFVAEANIVAKDVNIKLDEISEPEQTKFHVTSEDATKYYGRWSSGQGEYHRYAITYTIDLDDINWTVKPLDRDCENYFKVVGASERLEDTELNETLTTNFVKDFMKNNFSSYYDKYSFADDDENCTIYSPILVNSSGNKLTFAESETYYNFTEGTQGNYDINIFNRVYHYDIELKITVPLDSIEPFEENDPYGDSYIIVK